MEGSRFGRSPGLVQYTDAASDDLAIVHLSTSERWGDDPADQYLHFLFSVVGDLASATLKGTVVENNDLYQFVAKWRKARQGHRIIFRELNNGIRVIRVLHTAMEWPRDISHDNN